MNGSYEGMPAQRQYTIEVFSCMPPTAAASTAPTDEDQAEGRPIQGAITNPLPFVRHPGSGTAKGTPQDGWFSYDGHGLLATVQTPMVNLPQKLPYNQSVLVTTISLQWESPQLPDPGHSSSSFTQSPLQFAAGMVRRGRLVKDIGDKQIFPSLMK